MEKKRWERTARKEYKEREGMVKGKENDGKGKKKRGYKRKRI
jgi:hypothetical protein